MMSSLLKITFLTFILYAAPLGGQEFAIDNFEGNKLCNWYSWPGENIYLDLSRDAKNGKNALLINMRDKAGEAIKAIGSNALKDTNAYAISFWIKAAKGNQKEEIQIVIEEGKGSERYFANIKLPQEWTKITVKFSDFKISRWGDVRIVDGKLDTDDITNIRFLSYPSGAVFYLDDIVAITGKAPSAKAKGIEKNRSPVLKEIELADDYPVYDDSYPQEVQNVKIGNGNFSRNGKAVFLLGGWQTDNEGPPWIFRTLSIDVYPYNATEIYTLYPPKRQNGALEISWSPNPWYEAIIQRTLKNKIMFWQEHKSHAQWNALKDIMPEVVDCGHFVTYDPNNDLGIKFYNEMYKSWMRYTRQYPIFCYELFNEMGYNNTKKIAQEKFRKAMFEKYGEIAKANAVWETTFKSFDKVAPPGFIGNNNQLPRTSREVLVSEDAKKYPNLYIDWLKFQESDSDAAIKKLMPLMRQYDKSPKKLSTLQSHCQLFFDYGGIGINPESIEKYTDFYSHEIGQKFFDENSRTSTQNIKDMLRSSLSNDIVRNICKKPIFNAEAPIGISGRIATKEELEASDLGKLAGEWRFHDATKVEPEKWFFEDFNDSDWGKIVVPGMWGTQGYRDCSRGLYRKSFKLDLKQLMNRPIYLNGEAFSDASEIYLNGKYVGKTQGYKSEFSFDISKYIKDTNILSVKIMNEYFKDGMFYGGIRGYISINDCASRLVSEPALEPRHLRSFLWSQIVHGMSGVMLCYDNNIYQFAIRSLPRIKKEIESVSEIVLQRPAIDAQIAMIYPFETNRGIIHSNYIEQLSGPVSNDLADYYVPLLFSGLGLDVIRNKDILSEQVNKYKLIAMPGNIRIVPEELDALYQYVSNGGILVVEFGSLSLNDETHEKINPEKLLGVRINGLNQEILSINSWMTGKGPTTTRIRYVDKKTSANAEILSAKVLAEFTNGMPAITVNNVGKGKVYWIGGKFPYQPTAAILKNIYTETSLKAKVDVHHIPGEKALPFVETNLFQKDGRYVLFAQNWGKSGIAILSLNSIPSGNYLVRNLTTSNIFPPPDGKKYWTSDDLQKQLCVKMSSLDPVVLLIENSTLTPLQIKNISPARYEILNQLWVTETSSNGAPIVAFAPEESMSCIYGNQPTADKLLSLSGYRTLSYIEGETDLSKVNVLIWPDAGHGMKNPNPFLSFIENGGGMLICGNGIMNYHMVISRIAPLLDKLMITQNFFGWLRTQMPEKGDDILNVSCKDISRHPITQYVNEFKTACAGVLTCKAKGSEILIKAPADSNIPGAPVLAAFSYGKGKVVYISDSWWLRPLNFEKADNAQLFVNIINWLADKPTEKLQKERLEKALYITSEKLEKAEKEEEDGVFEFKPFSANTSSLGKGGELQGTSGNDPIVDILKK